MSQSPDDAIKKKTSLTPPSGFLDELESDPNEDPDALLSQALPDLEKDMKQLQSDFIGLNAEIESLEFGDESIPTAIATSSLKTKLVKWKKKINHWFISFAEKLFYRIKYLLIWLIIEFPKHLLRIVKLAANQIKQIIHVFSLWSGKRKIFFFTACILLTSTTYLYFKVLRSNFLFQDDFHFYGSMAEIATHSFSYDLEGETEPFYNSPRVKVYSFKMKPVVVNLRKEKDSHENPMAYFEFVFVGNSGDVVVEFKERESELIDLVQRVIERNYYEVLDTPEGKEDLKLDLKKELNKKLTEGIIKKIELHNFFIKP